MKHNINLRLVAMYRSLLSKAALFVSVVTVSFSMVEKSCIDLVPPPMDIGGANAAQLQNNSSSSARDGISDSFMVVQ